MAKLTALTKNTSGLNSGAEVMAQRISLDKIIVHPTFQSLLPINEKELANIVSDMEENGFDKSKPVCVWREEDVLIDGYTRFTAAREAGLTEIYKYEMSFETEQQALEYAMKQQLNRRNLNDAGKLLLIEKLDNLRKTGRPSDEDDSPRGEVRTGAGRDPGNRHEDGGAGKKRPCQRRRGDPRRRPIGRHDHQPGGKSHQEEKGWGGQSEQTSTGNRCDSPALVMVG